jgi:hypothetical protein
MYAAASHKKPTSQGHHSVASAGRAARGLEYHIPFLAPDADSPDTPARENRLCAVPP